MSKVKRILSNQKTRLTSRSLSRELALSLILLLILFQGLLLAYVYNRQSRVMKQELEKKADDLAVNLSELLVVPLWDYDDEQIGKIGMSFLAIEVIEEVLIKNSSREILFNVAAGKEPRQRIQRSVRIGVPGSTPRAFAESATSIVFAGVDPLAPGALTRVLAQSFQRDHAALA